jgi:hypothetical protein
LSHWLPSHAVIPHQPMMAEPPFALACPRGFAGGLWLSPQLGCFRRPQKLGQRNLLSRGTGCIPVVSYSPTTLFSSEGGIKQDLHQLDSLSRHAIGIHWLGSRCFLATRLINSSVNLGKTSPLPNKFINHSPNLLMAER